MKIHSIAVFCGSKSGNNPLLMEHARQIGTLIAQKNITLIYGGSKKGIMGQVAGSALEAHGKVIGIIPKVLMEWEQHHQGLSELHEVQDMHVRKAMLYQKCNAAIILPGGYGTLDEFFEMLTWNQLNIHNKKIFILNTSGFYDHLILHLKKMEEENFLYDKFAERLTVLSVPSELETYL